MQSLSSANVNNKSSAALSILSSAAAPKAAAGNGAEMAASFSQLLRDSSAPAPAPAPAPSAQPAASARSETKKADEAPQEQSDETSAADEKAQDSQAAPQSAHAQGLKARRSQQEREQARQQGENRDAAARLRGKDDAARADGVDAAAATVAQAGDATKTAEDGEPTPDGAALAAAALAEPLRQPLPQEGSSTQPPASASNLLANQARDIPAENSPMPEAGQDKASARSPAALDVHAKSATALGQDEGDASQSRTGPKAEDATAFGAELRQAAAAPANTPTTPATAKALPHSALQALAQSATAGLPGQAAPTGAAATARVDLTARPDSAQFAPEMAARVSVLAADGVQQAELHLNPAELGPVTVQIQLDGQQAQVSFHAEHSETRSALEGSLPELATALREQGLTLSGGGVFQQSAQQRQQQDSEAAAQQAARRSSSFSLGGEAVESPAAQPVQRPSRGLVDYYA